MYYNLLMQRRNFQTLQMSKGKCSCVAVLAPMVIHLAKDSYQFGLFVFNSLSKNQLNLKKKKKNTLTSHFHYRH